MKKGLLYLQVAFDIAVAALAIYGADRIKRITSTMLENKYDLEGLGEDIDIVDDRITDVQAELEKQIMDLENGTGPVTLDELREADSDEIPGSIKADDPEDTDEEDVDKAQPHELGRVDPSLKGMDLGYNPD